jgi:hypothetical protein
MQLKPKIYGRSLINKLFLNHGKIAKNEFYVPGIGVSCKIPYFFILCKT